MGAYLNPREYLFDFVVNAHILYDGIVSRLVVDGHLEEEAVEIANREILSGYFGSFCATHFGVIVPGISV